jgi:hypothetical protein
VTPIAGAWIGGSAILVLVIGLIVDLVKRKRTP